MAHVRPFTTYSHQTGPCKVVSVSQRPTKGAVMREIFAFLDNSRVAALAWWPATRGPQRRAVMTKSKVKVLYFSTVSQGHTKCRLVNSMLQPTGNDDS